MDEGIRMMRCMLFDIALESKLVGLMKFVRNNFPSHKADQINHYIREEFKVFFDYINKK